MSPGPGDGRPVALVTGSANGIGRATVEALVRRGVAVVACDSNGPAGQAAADEVGATFLCGDVRDMDFHRAAVGRAAARFGGLDIVVLNAGIMSPRSSADPLDVESYRRVMAVNVDGVVLGLDAVVPALRARGGGVVVATASLAGLAAVPADPVYAATKHAVVGLVRSLAPAPALVDAQIRVNAVCPGFVDTALVDDHRADLESDAIPLLPVRRVVETILTLIDGEMSGECWFVQAGRPAEPFKFRRVPGPR